MIPRQGGTLLSQSVAYVVNKEKLKLDIAILDINQLHLHEETIPKFVGHLARSIKKDGCCSQPAGRTG